MLEVHGVREPRHWEPSSLKNLARSSEHPERKGFAGGYNGERCREAAGRHRDRSNAGRTLCQVRNLHGREVAGPIQEIG